MSVISKIQKVTVIPIRISINKLFDKLFTINNKSKYLSKLYNINHYKISLNNDNLWYINNIINSINKIDYNIIDNIFKHQFNLLSSSNNQISNTTIINTYNNNSYKNILPIFTTLYDACNYLLLNEHKSTACKILEHIPNDYKLIDWQLDCRSGYRWSEKHTSTEIKIGNVRGADVKVPWELARFQHLPLLAIYYAQNPDLDNEKKKKLINEFCNEILDFIAFNPINYGIHWKVAMEVSIRATNICFAFQIFNTLDVQFSKDFENIFLNFLNESLQFIIEHIEWSSGLRGNHYFTNISAILYLTSFLGVEQFNDLFNSATDEIINETLVQFNQDGGNFEGSFCYHLFVVEMLVWDMFLIDKIAPQILENHKLFNEFQTRIDKIMDFTMQMLGRKNYIPQIGDNDSGYFLGLDCETNSLNNIRLILRSFSNDIRQTKICDTIIRSEFYKYLINNDNTEIIENYKIFPESGIFVYQNKDYKIWIILGSKPQFGKGGHNHQDTTSFILQMRDNPVIVDPGTYVYTAFPEMRNLFRSYFYHNSYCPNNYKIKTREIDDLFWLKSELCQYQINSNSITLNRKIDGVKHSRKFIFYDDSIEIIDEFNRAPRGSLLYHLDPSIEIQNQTANEINLLSDSYQLIIKSSNNNLSLDKYNYSYKYGNMIESNVIKFINLLKLNKLKISIINGTSSK